MEKIWKALIYLKRLIALDFQNSVEQEMYNRYQDSNVILHLYTVIWVNIVSDICLIASKYPGYEYVYYLLGAFILCFVALYKLKKYYKVVIIMIQLFCVAQYAILIEVNLISFVELMLKYKTYIKDNKFYLYLVFDGYYYSQFLLFYVNIVPRWLFKFFGFIVLSEYIFLRLMFFSFYWNYLFQVFLVSMLLFLYMSEKTSRNMFLKLHQQQIQLKQFKELLDIHIPQPLCVLSLSEEIEKNPPSSHSDLEAKDPKKMANLENGSSGNNGNRPPNNNIPACTTGNKNNSRTDVLKNQDAAPNTYKLQQTFFNQNFKRKFNQNNEVDPLKTLKQIPIKQEDIDTNLQNPAFLCNTCQTTIHRNIKNLYDYVNYKLTHQHQSPDANQDSTAQQIYNCQISQQIDQFVRSNSFHLNNLCYYDIKLLLFNWNNVNSILLVFNDVSAKYREIQIRQLENYKSKVLESISHNLKTPLHCIQLYLDMMKTTTNPGKLATAISSIDVNMQILNSQICQILDFSTIQKGEELQLDCSEFCIYDSLTKMKKLFNQQIQFKNINITYKLEPGLMKLKVVTDKNRLENILIDLIQNALKHCDSGQIVIGMTLSPIDKDLVYITIQNTAKPQKEAKGSDTYNEVMRMHKNTEDGLLKKKHSLGFTLQICQLIVNQIGPSQQLEIQTIPDFGTQIQFMIYKKFRQPIDDIIESFYSPLRINQNFHICHEKLSALKQITSLTEISDVDEQAEIDTAHLVPEFKRRSNLINSIDHGTDAKCQKAIRVLIVDDNTFNIMGLNAVLQQFSQITLIDKAYNGKQCIDQLDKIISTGNASKQYDVIFMDINMPEMDGFEATQLIKQKKDSGQIKWKMKIIMLSAFTNAKDKEYALSIGAEEYWGKPIGMQALHKIIESL